MTRAGDRLALEVSEGARGRATSDELAELISRAVGPVVAHDGMRLVGTCPAAGSAPATFSFWHGYEPGMGRAVLREYYSGADPWLPDDLAALARPVGVVTCGDGVELRWLLRDGHGAWGGFTLLRDRAGRPFDRDDVDRVARLAPMLIAVLRRYVTAGPLTPVIPKIPAGVYIVGPHDTVRAATPHALRWRDVVVGSQLGPDWLGATPLFGLATLASDPRGRPAAVCAPSVAAGRWIAVEAHPLGTAGEVAVVFQAATGEQLLPYFCDWYGITARERAVIAELCDAAAPKQIARRLGLSVYTVNDHLKAVFRKTGAGSRAELMSALNG